ncbi:mitochondrial import receptor subunit TOM70-like [Dysidea avara]|uniref:mitochondrial import receptor subunit TOM70-like n=1 Tax=Dysidea avara TaxID=196820 RepID=UPI0033257131
MSEDTSGGTGWQRWQLAVAIGVPVTIATGCALYYFWSKETHSSGSHDPINKTTEQDAQASVSSVTTEDNDGSQDQNNGLHDQNNGSHDPPHVSKLELAEAEKTKGNKYFKGRKYDSALKCYENAIQMCPPENPTQKATYYQNMAACYDLMAASETGTSYKDSCYHEVIRLTTEAIQLNNKYVKAYQRRGKAREHFKLHKEQLYDMTATMLLDPQQQMEQLQEKCNDVVKVLVMEQIKQDYPDGKKLQNLSYTYAMNYHDSFCYHGYVNEQELLDKYQSCDQNDEGKSLQLLITAVREFHAGNYGNIIPLCSEAIESESDYPELIAMALLLRGEMQFLWQHREEALQDLNRVADMSDVDKELRINARLQRCYIYCDSMETDQAQLECKRALELDRYYGDTFLLMAKVSMLTGTPQGMMQAMELLEKAYHHAPDYHNVITNLAYMKFRFTQSIESSRQLFIDATRKFPQKSEVFVMYAQMLQDCMQVDEAMKLYEKAISLQPNIASTYVYLGLLHLMVRKDLVTALDTVAKGLDVDPHCMLVYMTLGSLEMQRNLTKAIEMLDKAIEVSHTDTDLLQAYSVRELAQLQQQVCEDLNIDPLEVMSTAAMTTV